MGFDYLHGKDLLLGCTNKFKSMSIVYPTYVINNFTSSAGVVVVSGFHISTVAVGNQTRKIMVDRMAQTD
jgi:hypothetical protein